MAQAATGDTVKVHYTGKLEDGSVFDTSQQREPLEFKLGEGRLLPGFEQAVEGLEPGQKTEIEIAAEQGYGPRRDDAVVQIERSQLPPDLNPEIGQQLQMQQPNGQAVVVTVAETSEESITLDGNHPLAGKDLSFEIELVEIV